MWLIYPEAFSAGQQIINICSMYKKEKPKKIHICRSHKNENNNK